MQMGVEKIQQAMPMTFLSWSGDAKTLKVITNGTML
jgi:hypothetical protein